MDSHIWSTMVGSMIMRELLKLMLVYKGLLSNYQILMGTSTWEH